MKMITEQNNNKWAQIISEELGVKDSAKLAWMSKMAQVQEIKEGIDAGHGSANIYATPLNTLGMGNPMMPMGNGFNNPTDGGGIGNTGSDFHAHNYVAGSGDIPMSTLTMSLEVAAQTIGLELVPVIPSTGPWAMLQYMDFPYAGGKLGRINETSLDGKGADGDNKPIYIKVSDTLDNLSAFYKGSTLKSGDKLTFENAANKAKLHALYIGKSRIDTGIVVKVVKAHFDTDETNYASIAEVFSGEVTVNGKKLPTPHADLVATYADHVQEFSNFFGDGKGNGSDEPMTRAQNETGVGNTIGARFFTKMIQMGSYEVTGTVTRQQLQDMPLYGIDVVGKVLEAMQNELSQAINNRILDRLFKLGTTNALIQKQYQNIDLNLYFGNAGAASTKNLSDFAAAGNFVGIDNVNAATNWGPVHNAIQNTAAENVYTHQRRIMSRCLAAANVIANVSRWGRGQWIVTNTQVLSALQDCAGFVVNPMANDLVQDGSRSIYFAGSVAGMSVYVDPYMAWDDTRVLVGRKSDGKTPGVVFMPYILCDTVQTIVEGTMAPKLLVNSRFSVVSTGFHPEQNYLCFMIDANDGFIL
nr:MAG TPA: major capsid protein [Caudoviricetes sp.]